MFCVFLFAYAALCVLNQ